MVEWGAKRLYRHGSRDGWEVDALLLGMLLLALISPPQALAASTQLPRVLVIESYHADYSWDQQYTRGLRARLDGVAELSFFEMDTKRLPAEQFPGRAEAAWERYLSLQPELVVLADDNALQLLGPRFAATKTPVVYLGINQNPRRYFDQPPANISGVLERPFLRRSIAYLNLIMQRPLTRVLVLFDNGTTSQTVLEESFDGQPEQRIGSTAVHIRLLSSEEGWQQTIRSAPQEGYDLIVLGLYHTLRNAAGQHVPEQQVLAWSSVNSSLPLFSFWAFSVGEGMTIGGLVLDGYDQGVAAGEMAREVLQGGKLPRLPVSPGGGALMFSRSQLQRWEIDLPERLKAQAMLVP